jgi:hypothetical protein
VAGDASTAMQDLDGVIGDARINGFTDQRVRHAVVMCIDLDVIVDVDAAGLELRHFIRLFRQRHQRWPIDRLEPLAASADQLLERTRVQIDQQFCDRMIERKRSAQTP